MPFFIGKISRIRSDKKELYFARLSDSGRAFAATRLAGELSSVSDGEKEIGFLKADSGRLTGFFVYPEYYALAESALSYAIASLGITCASVLTSDSPLIALLCPFWKTVRATAACYEYLSDDTVSAMPIRCAGRDDVGFLEKCGLMDRERIIETVELHGAYILGGERPLACAFAERESVHTFISVYVEEDSRGKGMGSMLLKRMGVMCADYAHKALALCDLDNKAGCRALEKAGYVAFDKLLEITF